METIYLDNNATTRPAPEVIEAMLPYLAEWYGNPSSIHRFGQRARRGVDEARAQVAGLLGCADSEITFTGGGTEAINTAIRSLLASRAPRGKIVISAVEHSATLETCKQLARDGVEIVEIGVDRDGQLDMDRLKSTVDDQTALVSIMWANNETGVIFPVAQIAEICRSAGVPFHCDGTQAVGKIPARVKEVGVDMMSMAAHKFHGPKGVGSLYARKGLRVRPLLSGGSQEHGRRGGTENVAGIVGMGKAAEMAAAEMPRMAGVAALRDGFERRILAEISDTQINGRNASRLGNTSNISFARLEAEAILILLSEQGVCASAGSACSSGSLEPSHVLRAMKLEDRFGHGSVRFSLSRYTTQAELDAAVAVLLPIISRLRMVLPVGI